MEKVYWIQYQKDLREMNDELAKYGGHVTMISAAASTKDQDTRCHAYVVIAYPMDSFPRD